MIDYGFHNFSVRSFHLDSDRLAEWFHCSYKIYSNEEAYKYLISSSDTRPMSGVLNNMRQNRRLLVALFGHGGTEGFVNGHGSSQQIISYENIFHDLSNSNFNPIHVFLGSCDGAKAQHIIRRVAGCDMTIFACDGHPSNLELPVAYHYWWFSRVNKNITPNKINFAHPCKANSPGWWKPI